MKSCLNIKSIVQVMVVLTTLVGCVKNRPEQYLQGSGLANGDVVAKNKVLDVTESLTAGSKSQDATTREYKLTIEDSAKDKFDDLGYVEYETDSELLNNSPRFIGRPGASYTLRRYLQGNRLLVYKISDPRNISYIEKTNFVKTFEDGKIGVPFLSFPVSYFKVEHILDADRRRTNQKREIQIVDPLKYDEATHISVNWSNRVVLTEQGLDKSSLFPKSFFKEGEWHYSVFKTDSSDYQAGGNRFEFIHSRDSEQFGIFRSVKFTELNQETFAAVSAAVPAEIAQNNLSSSVVAPLKVNWIKLRVNSDFSGSSDEELDNTGSFRDSEYFQIDFKESFRMLAENFYNAFGARNTDIKNVSEVIIGEDLFSFIVESDTEKYRVNFMKRKNSNYKELTTHFEDSQKKFGVFYMQKPTFLANQRLQVEEDFYRYYRTVRFNPENKLITYHISEESPNKPAVQISAERAIKYINDSFKHIYRDKPNERIRVVLSSERVRRGDPRYNIIDYNSEFNPNTYGGLGNPYYDESTGEVVSATSFIYYGIYNYLLKEALTEYMGAETGIHLPAVQSQGENISPFINTANSVFENTLIYMPEEYAQNLRDHLGHTVLDSVLNFFPSGNHTFLKPCVGANCSNQNSAHDNHISSLVEYSQPGSMVEVFKQNAVNNIASIENNLKDAHNVFNVNRRSGVKTFQKHCDLNAIKRIYTDLRGSSEYLNNDLVESCLETVLADVFVPTVVHEILHNFGLGHNMHGSTDKDNYLTPELIKQVYGEDVTAENNPSATNSIMDYFEYRTEDSPYPSTYDWAVLRFLYRNQIQLADGRYVDIKKPAAQKIMDDNVVELFPVKDVERNVGLNSRQFSYCMQAEMSWGTNPLCDTFDIGHNPYTIVKNYIEEYEYYTNLFAQKGTRYSYNTNQVNSFKARILTKLLNYYQQWRKELITVVGENNKYLESYNNTQDFYNDLTQKLMLLPEIDRARVLEYYQIRNIIYSFLRDQVFKAPYTCVYKQAFNGEEMFVFLDFDQIYRKMLSLSSTLRNEELTGCESRAVQQVSQSMLFERLRAVVPQAGANDVAYTYQGSVGVPVRNYSTNIVDARSFPGQFDITGYQTSKYVASMVLLPRQFSPYYHSDENFFPTFMDEPDFRDNFEQFLKNRYVNGFWVNESTSDIRSINLPSEVYQNILQKPEHRGFRTLLASYGENGARQFTQRLTNNELVSVVQNPNSEYMEFLVSSAYIQNEILKAGLENSEDNSPASASRVFMQTYGMFFVNSFLSESSLTSVYSNFFRSGLTVPNNLSVTAERTKRFQMGISSNDYAYIEFVRSRYPVFADLGSFLVYPKNDEATFARDLINELDILNSVDTGFADPSLDINKLVRTLGSLFNEFLKDYGQASDFGLGNNFPTIERYVEINRNFVTNLNSVLARDTESSTVTKQLIALMANRLLETVQTRINESANRVELNAFDRIGNKLNYTEALQELISLRSALQSMEQAVPLPSAQVSRQHYQVTYDNLLQVLTEFQNSAPISGSVSPLRPDSGAPDLVYNPIITQQELMGMILEEANKALERSVVYRFDSKELDEKKELLNKFLFILAISR